MVCIRVVIKKFKVKILYAIHYNCNILKLIIKATRDLTFSVPEIKLFVRRMTKYWFFIFREKQNYFFLLHINCFILTVTSQHGRHFQSPSTKFWFSVFDTHLSIHSNKYDNIHPLHAIRHFNRYTMCMFTIYRLKISSIKYCNWDIPIKIYTYIITKQIQSTKICRK